jgi:DNA invertase Pin-like site-specific DNA recombinase
VALYARTSTHDQNSGIRVGRPPARVDLVKAIGLLAGGQSLPQVARVLGIGASTLHRALQSGNVDSVPTTSPDDQPQVPEIEQAA